MTTPPSMVTSLSSFGLCFYTLGLELGRSRRVGSSLGCLVGDGQWLNFYFFKYLFIYLLATPRGMRDLSSPTRDRTRDPCSGCAES